MGTRAMDSEKATADSSGAARPGAPISGLPEFLQFLEGERRRSQRAAFAAALFGVAVGALATAAWWTRSVTPADAAAQEIAQRLHGLESSSGTLAAQVRALASRPQGGDGGGDAAPAPARTDRGDASIAGKPSAETHDGDGAARMSSDEALARALARAQQLPLVVSEPKAPVGSAALDAKSAAAAAAGPNGADPKSDPDAEAKARVAANEAILAAFNGLLVDCGLDQWRLMHADVASEDHSLHGVVLAHRSSNGAPTGSLTAERLALERDAGTGVAAFVLTGARRTEA